MDIKIAGSKVFISNILIALISFIGVAYFARELGPAAIGIYFLFEAVLRMSGTLSDLGIRGSVEKRISEGRSTKTYYSTGIYINLIIVIIASLVIYSFRGAINSYLGGDLALYLVLGTFLYSFAHFQNSLLKGDMRPGETAILNITHHLMWFIFGFIFINLGYGYMSLVYSYIIGKTSMIIIGVMKKSPPFSMPDFSTGKDIVNFAKYYFFSSATRYAYNWTDILIMGYILTSTAVGQYEVAWRVAGVTILLSRALGIVIFPQISSWHSSENNEKIKDLISASSVATTILIIPAIIGTAVISEPLLNTIFGPEYTAVSFVLIVLIIGKLFQGQLIVFEKTLIAINKPELSAKINILSNFSNIVLNVIFINEYGIIGAGFATSLAYLLSTLLHIHYINNLIGFEFYTRQYAWIIISSILMGIIIFSLGSYYPIVDGVSLIIHIFISTTIYSLILLMNQEFRTNLSSIT